MFTARVDGKVEFLQSTLL